MYYTVALMLVLHLFSYSVAYFVVNKCNRSSLVGTYRPMVVDDYDRWVILVSQLVLRISSETVFVTARLHKPTIYYLYYTYYYPY